MAANGDQNDAPIAARCSALTAKGEQCKNRLRIDGVGMCRIHEGIINRKGEVRFNEEQIVLRARAVAIRERAEARRRLQLQDLHPAVGIFAGLEAAAAAVVVPQEELDNLDRLQRRVDGVLEQLGDQRRRGNGELARLAGDRQNVHTSVVVKQTKDIVKKIREIPVPEEYRWDPEVCSKTPGEIITECKLKQAAAWQMVSQYAQDVAIYDIEIGIYGKVLDSMWQFVKAHPEKESLISIIRTELNDSVGMCAQGNLTRICNVLAGYLEGVGSQESLSERLGRLMAPLMDIEDEGDRFQKAAVILRENKVPYKDWHVWLTPLLDEPDNLFED